MPSLAEERRSEAAERDDDSVGGDAPVLVDTPVTLPCAVSMRWTVVP